jgi:hypothetical protein
VVLEVLMGDCQLLMDAFVSVYREDIFVFLLSTRAGGLGINLTAADTVSLASCLTDDVMGRDIQEICGANCHPVCLSHICVLDFSIDIFLTRKSDVMSRVMISYSSFACFKARKLILCSLICLFVYLFIYCQRTVVGKCQGACM